jgi:hypothetical protein
MLTLSSALALTLSSAENPATLALGILRITWYILENVGIAKVRKMSTTKVIGAGDITKVFKVKVKYNHLPSFIKLYRRLSP